MGLKYAPLRNESTIWTDPTWYLQNTQTISTYQGDFLFAPDLHHMRIPKFIILCFCLLLRICLFHCYTRHHGPLAFKTSIPKSLFAIGQPLITVQWMWFMCSLYLSNSHQKDLKSLLITPQSHFSTALTPFDDLEAIFRAFWYLQLLTVS